MPNKLLDWDNNTTQYGGTGQYSTEKQQEEQQLEERRRRDRELMDQDTVSVIITTVLGEPSKYAMSPNINRANSIWKSLPKDKKERFLESVTGRFPQIRQEHKVKDLLLNNSITDLYANVSTKKIELDQGDIRMDPSEFVKLCGAIVAYSNNKPIKHTIEQRDIDYINTGKKATKITSGKKCNIGGCANNTSRKCQLEGRVKTEPNSLNCPEFVGTHGFHGFRSNTKSSQELSWARSIKQLVYYIKDKYGDSKFDEKRTLKVHSGYSGDEANPTTVVLFNDKHSKADDPVFTINPKTKKVYLGAERTGSDFSKSYSSKQSLIDAMKDLLEKTHY